MALELPALVACPDLEELPHWLGWGWGQGTTDPQSSSPKFIGFTRIYASQTVVCSCSMFTSLTWLFLSILFKLSQFFCGQSICQSPFFTIGKPLGFVWCCSQTFILVTLGEVSSESMYLLSQLSKFVDKLLVPCGTAKDADPTCYKLPWAHLRALQHLASEMLLLTGKSS